MGETSEGMFRSCMLDTCLFDNDKDHSAKEGWAQELQEESEESWSWGVKGKAFRACRNELGLNHVVGRAEAEGGNERVKK